MVSPGNDSCKESTDSTDFSGKLSILIIKCDINLHSTITMAAHHLYTVF